jgi:hypothetical protein
MRTTLEIGATVQFDSIEEARIAGQVIEQFLGIKGKRSVRLYDFESNDNSKLPVKKSVPLYLPERTSNITRGKQDTDSRLINLVKNIHNSIPALPVDSNLSDGVMILNGQQWVIDYQRLFDNVGKYADKAEVKEAFNTAVAITLQQEATGRIR